MFVGKLEGKLAGCVTFIHNNALYLIITKVNIYEQERSLFNFYIRWRVQNYFLFAVLSHISQRLLFGFRRLLLLRIEVLI